MTDRLAPQRCGAAGSRGGPADALAALSKSTHFDWRLAPYDIARLDGARAGAAPGRAAHRRRAHRHARRAGPSSPPTSQSGAFTPAPADEDVHTALERGPDRAGRPGARRQAARRPVAQRPGRHAVPDVPARRGPPHRAGRAATSSTRCVGAGRRPPRRADARPHPPAARPAGAAGPPPGRARAGPAARRRPARATGTAAPPSRPTGRARWPGSSLGLDPEAVAAELGFAASAANSIDGTAARDFAAEVAFVCAMIAVDLSRVGRGGHPLVHGGVRLRHARRRVLHRQSRSCRRRRTRTSPSWPAARPGG